MLCSIASAEDYVLVSNLSTPKDTTLWSEIAPCGYSISSGQYFIEGSADCSNQDSGFYALDAITTPQLVQLVDGSIVAKWYAKAGVAQTNRINLVVVGNGSMSAGTFAHFAGSSFTVHRDGGSNIKLYSHSNNSQTELASRADYTLSTTVFEEYRMILNATNLTVEFKVNNETKISVGLSAATFLDPVNFKFSIQNSNGGTSGTELFLANLSYMIGDVPTIAPSVSDFMLLNSTTGECLAWRDSSKTTQCNNTVAKAAINFSTNVPAWCRIGINVSLNWTQLTSSRNCSLGGGSSGPHLCHLSDNETQGAGQDNLSVSCRSATFDENSTGVSSSGPLNSFMRFRFSGYVINNETVSGPVSNASVLLIDQRFPYRILGHNQSNTTGNWTIDLFEFIKRNVTAMSFDANNASNGGAASPHIVVQ